MIHPRNLIIAEPQSQAAVVEDYVSFERLPRSATRLQNLLPGMTPSFHIV